MVNKNDASLVTYLFTCIFITQKRAKTALIKSLNFVFCIYKGYIAFVVKENMWRK